MSEEITSTGQDKIQRYKWETKGQRGSLAYVSKSELHIDPSYQRDVIRSKVLKIAQDWNWMSLGALTAAERNGVLYIVDGQHRLMAAKKRSDVQELPCVIFLSSGAEAEAKGFVESNTNRKPVRVKDRHQAMLMYNDPIAIRVQELLDEGGKTIGGGGNTPDSVKSVSLLHRLCKTSPAELDALWPILCELTRGKYMHERLIDGLVWIEKNLPEGQSLCDARWRKRLESIGSEALVKAAGEGAAFFARGGAKNWGIGMIQVINKGARTRLSVKD